MILIRALVSQLNSLTMLSQSANFYPKQKKFFPLFRYGRDHTEVVLQVLKSVCDGLVRTSWADFEMCRRIFFKRFQQKTNTALQRIYRHTCLANRSDR